MYLLLITNDSCHDRGHAYVRGVPDTVPSNLKLPRLISAMRRSL